MAALEMTEILSVLEAHAPLALAENWDNVGLLIEASHSSRVRRLFLTVDLTSSVTEEALDAGAELIIAYHPILFAPIHRLVSNDPQSLIVMDLIRAGVSLYSPHTALDAAIGGVNDWLADAFGPGERTPLKTPDGLPEAENVGQGRRIELKNPLSLGECVTRVKEHLGLKHVRVSAPAADGEVRTIALCAGAGGSILEGVAADLYLTGEMRHHDILAAREQGTHVIVCDHTNTERGFLSVWRERLLSDLSEGVEIIVSSTDADPLQVS